VWPAWFSRLFPEGGTFRVESSRDGTPQAAWEQQSIDLVAKRVCGSCNSGWLSGIESDARPILEPLIRGQAVFLPREHVVTLARWATRFSLVLDLSAPRKGGPYFAEETRHAFAASRILPGTLSLWAADYVGHHVAWSSIRNHSFVVAGHATPLRAVTATFVIGRLALQVFDVTLRGTGLPTFDLWARDLYLPASVRLWPDPGQVSWLPEMSLDDEELARFARRFETRP